MIVPNLLATVGKRAQFIYLWNNQMHTNNFKVNTHEWLGGDKRRDKCMNIRRIGGFVHSSVGSIDLCINVVPSSVCRRVSR